MMEDKRKTISLCMIVKDEIDNIESMWLSVQNLVDEWIVVDTGSTDGTIEKCKELGAKVYEVGDKYCERLTKEQVDFFQGYDIKAEVGEKIFHFGNARTESFRHATRDFILWLDADDLLIGSAKLRSIIDLNLDKEQQLGLHMSYHYEMDKHQNIICKHYRERVFPNNSKFNWVGRIHELVIPEVETKYITVKEEDSYILHNIPEDKKKFNSGTRNTKALLLDLFEQKKEKDPRTLYQLGEAFVSKESTKDLALKFYLDYLELSGWDEERAQASGKVCDIYLHKGDKQQALTWAFKSIQEKPEFPLGYANVAQCYYYLEDYENAIVWSDRCLGVEQPDTMTFVNEKHNKFTPLLILASSYFKLGKIEETLKACGSALKIEPLSDWLLNIRGTCLRSLAEEKVAEGYKNIVDYLVEEKELAKAVDVLKTLPWSHEDDPRLLGLRKTSVESLVTALESVKEENHSLDVEKLHEELPHLAYLDKELKSRNAKTVFLMSSENNNTVSEWLTTNGYDVTLRPQEGEKFDAVVAFGLIDRVYDSQKVFELLLKHVKPTGLCVVSNREGISQDVDPGQVRVYTVNGIRNLIASYDLTTWTCIPLPTQVIYTSFLPGKNTKMPSVGFICSQAIEEWGPLSIYQGIGGSEEATIYLSQELAAQGHQVTVYNNCPYQCTFQGVHWKHHSSLNENEEMDVAIIWRLPHYLEHYKFKAKKNFLWLHDVPEEYWFTEERLEKFEKIIVLSKYHRSLLPKISDDKFIISSNGVTELLSEEEQKVERDPMKIIYTSSYDRGLEHLLRMMPEILKQFPEVKLHVCYGWGQWDKMRTRKTQLEWKSKMMELLKQPGVVEHGRVGQKELAKEFLSASIFAYPCSFEEISCISVMKAQWYGCIPLTTDYAALAETNLVDGCKVIGNAKYADVRDEFKKCLLEALKTNVSGKVRQTISSTCKKRYAWNTVAKQWSGFIKESVK